MRTPGAASPRLPLLITGICLLSGCAGAELPSLQPAPGSGSVDLAEADHVVLEWRVPRPVDASVDGGRVRVLYLVSEDPGRFALIAAPGGDGRLSPIQTRLFPFVAGDLPSRVAIEHAVVAPGELDAIRSWSERIARQGGVLVDDEQVEAIEALRRRSTDTCTLPFGRPSAGVQERYGYCLLGSIGADVALEACEAPSDFRVLCDGADPSGPLPQVVVRLERSALVYPDIRPDEIDLRHPCYATGLGCADIAGVSDAELTMWTRFLQRAGLGAGDLAAELGLVETVRWAKAIVSAPDVRKEESLVWARFIERAPPLDCAAPATHPSTAAACTLEGAMLVSLPPELQSARVEIPRLRAELAAGASNDAAHSLLERVARLKSAPGSLLRRETCRVVGDVVDRYEQRLGDAATTRADAVSALAILIEAHSIDCDSVGAGRIVLDYCDSMRAIDTIKADVRLDSVTIGSKLRLRAHGSFTACDEFAAVWTSSHPDLLSFADSSVPEAIARQAGTVAVEVRFGDAGPYPATVMVVPPVDSVELVTDKDLQLVGQDRRYGLNLTEAGVPVGDQFCSAPCPFPLIVYPEGMASSSAPEPLSRLLRIRADTDVKAYLQGLPWTLRTDHPWEVLEFDVVGPNSLALPASGPALPDTVRLLLRFVRGETVVSAAALGTRGRLISSAVRWTVGNPDVVSIDGSDTIASVRPIAPGRTSVVAELKLRPDSILRDSLEIRVSQPAFSQPSDSVLTNLPALGGDSVTADPAAGSDQVILGVGERCVVTLPPAAADSIPIVWTSSDSTVATAVADTVVGNASGSALLTGRIGSSVTAVQALVTGLPPDPVPPPQPCRIP